MVCGGGVMVSVTVGGFCCWLRLLSRALTTISTAMTIASAPSTPAAHSKARCPEEKVRRAGGGRWLPAAGRGRMAVLGPRVSTAARDWTPDGIAAGAARPMVGGWLGRGGRRPDRTAETASANGPPLL